MMTLATGWYITLVTGLKVYTDRTASPKIKIQKIDKKYKTDFYFLHNGITLLNTCYYIM